MSLLADDSSDSIGCLKKLRACSLQKLNLEKPIPLHKEVLIKQFTFKIQAELKPVDEALDRKLLTEATHLNFKADLTNVRLPLTKKQRAVLRQFIDHAYANSRIVFDRIFDTSLDKQGVGFFRFKTPSHVKKLRKKLSQPYSLPLDKHLQKELHEITTSALKKKPWLRHINVENLYYVVNQQTRESKLSDAAPGL